MKPFAADTVFVTDVAEELGCELVDQFLLLGAQRVYAAEREPREWTDPRINPVELDPRNADSISRASAGSSDATILVDMGSSIDWPPVGLGQGDTPAIRALFEINVFGAIQVASAFAPTLSLSGRGVIVVMQSVQAWINLSGAYAASHAARWSSFNALRLELKDANISILAAVKGLSSYDEKEDSGGTTNDPTTIAKLILTAVEDKKTEVLLDAFTRQTRRRLVEPIEVMYPELTPRSGGTVSPLDW
jgi:NAD(P)-dependent dehydrogenase (short-subunit alcohol dehydrogenase family)